MKSNNDELNSLLERTNRELFSVKAENTIQYMYEKELEASIALIFHRMRKRILKNLKEYYSTDVMFNVHADLILSPIHELHKKYYETIIRYKNREYRKGKAQAKRLVTRAKRYAKNYGKMYGSIKADTTNLPMSSLIKKDELFATSEFSAEHMRDKTFVASENTLARVDSDINGIITDGYRDGWGINDVANRIETRFDQLETWEARRISRTEIHGSHMQGVMQGYQDMGVEYTQWASAHDSRTRDTHSALDGEIIPFGGTYSNGLRYPGDTNGPISEWINCRCGCLPWFCPPGFMVPVGMTNFRESDLVATLDKWSNEQLLTSLSQSNPTSKYKIRSSDLEFDFKIKSSNDLSEFTKLKTNEEIADFFDLKYIKNGPRFDDAESFEFYDPKHNCTIRFGKSSTNRMKNIDYSNNGNSQYDLREVLKAYDEAPIILKESTEYINFLNKDDGLTCGVAHTNWKGIDMYEPSLRRTMRRGAEFEPFDFSLYHEMGHCFDARMTDIAGCDVGDLELSLGRNWHTATKNDHKFQIKKFGQSFETTRYGADDAGEDFAEMIATVACREKGMNFKIGSSYKIPDLTRPSGFRRDYRTLTEVKDANPNRYTLAKKYLNQIKTDHFVSGDSVDLKNIKEFNLKPKKILSNIKGYDKYALTSAEEKTLAKLEPDKDILKFKDRRTYQDLADRKEFNEMWNKILREGGDPTDYFAIDGAEGVKYEKLFKKFKDWVPKQSIEIKPIEINKKGLFKDKDAFKLTSEEKQVYKQLKQNKNSLSSDEKEYYFQLSNKMQLNRKHSELVKKGLDEFDSKEYVKLYQTYAKEWDLPKISPKANFSTEGFEKSQRFRKEYSLAKEFKLTTKESNELYNLEKKQLINPDSLNSSQITRMKYLQDKQEFNRLYSMKIQDKGLSYSEETKFKEYFAKLKYELNLHADLLGDQLPVYDLTIKPEPITSKTKLIRLKGTTENGLLPGNRNIEDYFTIDVSKCNPQERRVLNRWLSNDYAHFRDVIGRCDGDLDKFTDYVLKLDEERLNKYYYFVSKCLKEGNIELAKQEIREIGLSIKHDYPILENIIENNQLKEAMTLWRTEERLHIEGKLEKGKIVTFKGNNSTAVTREGAEHFAEISQREFKWMYEIEAPAGTRGAYVSHMFDSNPKYAQEMEFLLAKDTKMEIITFDEAKHYVKFRIVPEYEPKSINSSFTKYITKDGTKSINVLEVDDPSEFLGYLIKAEDSGDPRAVWRVELPESVSNYEGCKMFVTEHGSTIAIREDGDIISVCAYKNAEGNSLDSSRALLEFATENGGDRFDSFDGNYGFYRNCGFEPVSHIEFNEEYAPPGWVKGIDDPENVIFFKYTGERVPHAKKEEFLENVKPITGDNAYDDAYAIRDKSIEKDLELK